MILHITDAKYIGGYKIEVSFNDGKTGIADFSDTVKDGIFRELKDKGEFSRFNVDAELDTLVWQNGADLAPEYIYFLAFGNDKTLQSRFRKWGYFA